MAPDLTDPSDRFRGSSAMLVGFVDSAVFHAEDASVPDGSSTRSSLESASTVFPFCKERLAAGFPSTRADRVGIWHAFVIRSILTGYRHREGASKGRTARAFARSSKAYRGRMPRGSRKACESGLVGPIHRLSNHRDRFRPFPDAAYIQSPTMLDEARRKGRSRRDAYRCRFRRRRWTHALLTGIIHQWNDRL